MIVLATVGLAAGILSGLLGIGGGLILVPCLIFTLASGGHSTTAVALATSLAVMLFTGSWAAYQQARLDNVDFDKVRKLGIGVGVGAVFGGLSAGFIPDVVLKVFFCVFAIYAGLQMLNVIAPRMSTTFSTKTASVAGLVTGGLSSWLGIGGGTVVVPFLVSTGEPMQKAVGISSAIGVVVAVFASLGYAWSAWTLGVSGPLRWGFVDLVALASIVPTSLIGAHFGVRLGPKLSTPFLKKLFAFVLLASAAKLAVSI